MQPHLESVNHILDELDNGVEDRMKMAAKLVMEAGVVPDIVVTTMLDEPELAHGVAMLEMHVAAMSLKKIGSGVMMRGGNGVSRSVNVLLRLVRHALLSHSCSKAILISGATTKPFSTCREQFMTTRTAAPLPLFVRASAPVEPLRQTPERC